MLKKISQWKQLNKALAVLCVVVTFSCASKKDIDNGGLASDETLLLDENGEVKETDLFSDLNPQATDQVAAALMVGDDGSSPYYKAVGGESLRRVSYMLYSDRGLVNRLLERNSDLQASSRLSAEQKVYFDLTGIKPRPEYLTKDMIDRYSAELALGMTENAKKESLVTTTVVLSKGETLQDLSMRMYGTSRRWPEIYLLNREKIAHYDNVQAGATIEVFQVQGLLNLTQQVPVEAVQPQAQPVLPLSEEETAPEQNLALSPTLNNQPEEQLTTPDSMPEAPAIPTTNEALQISDKPASEAGQSFWKSMDSTNARRIVYVVLILGIAIAAFYLTRPSQKQKFDMLDVTAADTAHVRQRLEKEGQHKDIG